MVYSIRSIFLDQRFRRLRQIGRVGETAQLIVHDAYFAFHFSFFQHRLEKTLLPGSRHCRLAEEFRETDEIEFSSGRPYRSFPLQLALAITRERIGHRCLISPEPG